MPYRLNLQKILTKADQKLLAKLNTPNKIQDYLDSISVNTSKIGASIKSPSVVIKDGRAHCIEAAVFAAIALAYHERPGYLLDLRASNDDEDHVVALFKEGGLWGAISKTTHPVLRWRDAVYKNVRELTMSYAHEYFLFQPYHFAKRVSANRMGTKTLREYSKPFDIRKYNPSNVWGATNLDWLAEELDDSPHLPLYPKSVIKKLRKANAVEIKAANVK